MTRREISVVGVFLAWGGGLFRIGVRKTAAGGGPASQCGPVIKRRGTTTNNPKSSLQFKFFYRENWTQDREWSFGTRMVASSGGVTLGVETGGGRDNHKAPQPGG